MAVQVMNVPSARRISRRPAHHWHLKQRPWQLQPMMIAPVLAGETLLNLRYQCRTVSKPIKNSLIGWWHETYFFYVKLSDMERGSVDEQAITNMLIDPTYNIVTALGADAANVKNYHHAGTLDWMKRCSELVCDHYFREEGEDPTAAGPNIDAVPLVSTLTEGSWLDSMREDTDITANDVYVPAADPDGGGPLGVSVSTDAMVRAMEQWTLLKQQGMTKQTYEEYLRTFGVSVPNSEIGKPELLRYNRSWSYPTNTVEPTTGVPSAALSWSIQERADKRRLFREPGFICGFQVIRPKVYRKAQSGSLVDSLNSAIKWLPALLWSDTEASQIVIDNAASGPLTGMTNDYRLDLKDLFLYGDQFLNHSTADTGYNEVTLPDADASRRYADGADADALFAAAAPANTIETDGICQLSISGHLQDTTP